MRYENQLVTGDVTLDGNEFIDCTLQDCRVVFHGEKPFSFVRTRMGDNVRFGVAGQAKLTIEFLQFVRGVNPQWFEQLLNAAPKAVPDSSSTMN